MFNTESLVSTECSWYWTAVKSQWRRGVSTRVWSAAHPFYYPQGALGLHCWLSRKGSLLGQPLMNAERGRAPCRGRMCTSRGSGRGGAGPLLFRLRPTARCARVCSVCQSVKQFDWICPAVPASLPQSPVLPTFFGECSLKDFKNTTSLPFFS